MLRFTLLCLGVWLHAADSLVTATIAPAIVGDLHGIAYINWTISLYQIGAIVSGTATGVLCARFDIKRVFLGATLAYAIGCLLGASSPHMMVLVASRFVQGLGGGILLSLCYVAVEAWYPPSAWGRLFGIVAVVWAVGSLLGPLIGALFAASHLWRGAFIAFAVQGGALSLMIAATFPAAAPRAVAPPGSAAAAAGADVPPGTAAAARRPAAPHTAALSSPPSPSSASPPPSASPSPGLPVLPLLVLCAATLLIAEAGIANGAAPAIAGCLLGTALLYLAARLDARARTRLLPKRLLDLRHPLGLGLMMVFALAVGTTGFWAYGPLIMKILFDTKPLISGYILASEAIAWSVGTMLVSHAGPDADRRLIRTGVVAIALGSSGFALAVPSGSLSGMVVCALLQGAGFGICWPAVVQRVVRLADTSEKSLASGAVSTVQRIGYAVGTAAVGIAANLSGLVDGATPAAAKSAGFWVFAAFVPVLLTGVGCGFAFTRSCETGAFDVKSPPDPQ